MKFARWVFRIAGIYGLIVLVPQYFLEGKIAEQSPPAITHSEFFYGFLGVGIAWQIAFLIICAKSAAISGDDFPVGAGKIQLWHRRRGAVLSRTSSSNDFGRRDYRFDVRRTIRGCVAPLGCSIMPKR